MRHQHPHSRRRWLAAAPIVASLILVACGDDDDDESSVETSATSTAATTGTGTDAAATSSVEEYCEASFAIETAGEPEIDFETATPEEMAEAAKAYAKDTYAPLAAKLREVAPDEVKDDVEIGVAAIDELAETGDFEAVFGKPEVDEALDRLHQYDLKQCGWTTVNVNAVNYAFEGVPAEIDAGKVSFEFKNEGTELHEMIVFKRNEGVTEPFAELLELPQEEAEKKATFVGASFGPPGAEEYTVAELEPGSYAMVCFIPVGTTSEETESDGPPHFTQGMLTEFEVK